MILIIAVIISLAVDMAGSACPGTTSLIETTGTVTTQGIFNSDEECIWNFVPSFTRTLIKVDVTYFMVEEGGQCGTNHKGFLLLPGANQFCTNVPDTSSPKCFYFYEIRNHCAAQITANGACEERAITTSFSMEYHNGEGVAAAGINFNYQMLNCDAQSTSSTTTVATTTATSTRATTQTSISTSTTASTKSVSSAVGHTSTVPSTVTTHAERVEDGNSVVAAVVIVISFLLIVMIAVLVFIMARRRRAEQESTPQEPVTEDTVDGERDDVYTTIPSPARTNTYVSVPLHTVLNGDGYDTLHGHADGQHESNYSTIGQTGDVAIESEYSSVQDILNPAVTVATGSSTEAVYSKVFKKPKQTAADLDASSSYASLDHTGTAEQVAGTSYGTLGSSVDSDYATMSSSPARPNREMKSIRVMDPVTKKESIYADMSGPGPNQIPPIQEYDEFDSDEFEDESDEPTPEPAVYAVVKKSTKKKDK